MAVYQVKVSNKNDFDLEDRYDGVPYVIPARGALSIPYDAACHIFGFDFNPQGGIDREAIFRHLSKRWGWNRSYLKDKTTSAHKIRNQARDDFDKIGFEVISMTMVEKTVSSDGLAVPRASAPGTAPAATLNRLTAPKGKSLEAGAA